MDNIDAHTLFLSFCRRSVGGSPAPPHLLVTRSQAYSFPSSAWERAFAKLLLRIVRSSKQELLATAFPSRAWERVRSFWQPRSQAELGNESVQPRSQAELGNESVSSMAHVWP